MCRNDGTWHVWKHLPDLPTRRDPAGAGGPNLKIGHGPGWPWLPRILIRAMGGNAYYYQPNRQGGGFLSFFFFGATPCGHQGRACSSCRDANRCDLRRQLRYFTWPAIKTGSLTSGDHDILASLVTRGISKRGFELIANQTVGWWNQEVPPILKEGEGRRGKAMMRPDCTVISKRTCPQVSRGRRNPHAHPSDGHESWKQLRASREKEVPDDIGFFSYVHTNRF